MVFSWLAVSCRFVVLYPRESTPTTPAVRQASPVDEPMVAPAKAGLAVVRMSCMVLSAVPARESELPTVIDWSALATSVPVSVDAVSPETVTLVKDGVALKLMTPVADT